ncbi:metallophosphoesterase [Stygiolobus caldivivus]
MGEEKIFELLEKSKDIFKQHGTFLGEYNAQKVVFIGDTHGALEITKYAFDKFYDKVDLMVFLGDYVDRYPPLGVENLQFILEKMVETDAKKVLVLRGNHESPLTNYYYGFVEEVKQKFGDESVYEKFKDLFSYMPYAAVVNGYLCVHGGLPSRVDNDGNLVLGINSIDDIKKLTYPDVEPSDSIAMQILWNDPREGLEELTFVPNIRGEGTYYFGKKVVDQFLSQTGLKGIIRGHEAVDGFRVDIDKKVITVFSSIYHGQSAGILYINGDEIKRILIAQDKTVYEVGGL